MNAFQRRSVCCSSSSCHKIWEEIWAFYQFLDKSQMKILLLARQVLLISIDLSDLPELRLQKVDTYLFPVYYSLVKRPNKKIQVPCYYYENSFESLLPVIGSADVIEIRKWWCLAAVQSRIFSNFGKQKFYNLGANLDSLHSLKAFSTSHDITSEGMWSYKNAIAPVTTGEFSLGVLKELLRRPGLKMFQYRDTNHC